MSSPTFSIIIPHYDIPDLLIRCINSIPIREDVQVIVVDDNSPDADSYLALYPELSRPYLTFVKTKEGKGAGYARNTGIASAKGDWLLFADADDYFSDNLTSVFDNFNYLNEDVIYFRPAVIGNGSIRYNAIIDRYFESNDDEEIRCFYWVPWGKIYRKALIDKNSIRFDEIAFGNDVYFGTKVGCSAKSIKVEDIILYNYVLRKGSLSYKMSKPGEVEIRFDACFRAYKVMKQYGYTKYPGVFLYFFHQLYHNDKKAFRSYLKRLPEIGLSPFSALTKLRYREKGYWNKIKVYLCALF